MECLTGRAGKITECLSCRTSNMREKEIDILGVGRILVCEACGFRCTHEWYAANVGPDPAQATLGLFSDAV